MKKLHRINKNNTMIGFKTGFIKVIDYGFVKNKNRQWKCQCKCGKISFHSKMNLKRGIKSCGCYKFSGNKSPKWKGVGKLSAHFFK